MIRIDIQQNHCFSGLVAAGGQGEVIVASRPLFQSIASSVDLSHTWLKHDNSLRKLFWGIELVYPASPRPHAWVFYVRNDLRWHFIPCMPSSRAPYTCLRGHGHAYMQRWTRKDAGNLDMDVCAYMGARGYGHTSRRGHGHVDMEVA